MATALFGLGVVVGPTLGPTLGGFITDHFSWPWIFYVNIPLGMIAVLLSISYIKDTIHKKIGDVDWLGIFLLTAGIGSLQVVLERGESEDWFETSYISWLSIISFLGIIFFIWRELTTEHPVVDLRILKNRGLAIGMFTTFILGFGLFASVFVFPVFCQNILGFTAQQTGELMIPGGLSTIIMMPFVGRLLQKKFPPQIMATLGFIFFFGFTYMLAQSNLQSGEHDFLIPLILRGVGLALLFVPLTTLALGSLKPNDIPQGTGLNNMMRQLGGSFGIALITTYIHLRQGAHRVNLLTHVNIYDPAFNERFQGLKNGFMEKGYPAETAQSLAYRAIDGAVVKQTFLMTYMDAFWFVGIFFIICIPLLYLQRFNKTAKIAVDSH
jgi:DHA2 family multidrug resistance protein